MSKDVQSRTEELISTIERKDRRFRTAQVVFMTLLAVGVGAVLFFFYNIQSQNHTLLDRQAQLLDQQGQLLREQKTATETLKQNTNDQLSRANAHIDCIAHFFAQPNRATKSIDDLDKCAINQQVTPQAASGAPAPLSGTQKPSSGAQQSSNMQSLQPASNPAQQPQPITVLGIPACLSLAKICIDN